MNKMLPFFITVVLGHARCSTSAHRPSTPATVGLFLLALLLVIRFPVAAQAPAWQSVQAVAVATVATATGSSAVTATAVDAAGNVYVAGAFSNTVVMGSTTLTSLGTYDAFVAKFSIVTNQFVWAQRAGGAGGAAATALAVSGTGVYVAGYFGGNTADFGLTTLNNVGSGVTSDVFVAKLTDSGATADFVWAQRAGGAGSDAANALAVTGTNVYIAGDFRSAPADFGATVLSTVGYSDVFVAKLIDAGSTSRFAWAQRAGGTGDDFAPALASSGTSVYVAGGFGSSTAGFGPVNLTNAGSMGGGTSDLFVAKLVDAGNTGSFAWAQRAGGTSNDRATALAVSSASVYVAGYFQSTAASFGGSILLNPSTTGYGEVFVAKLTDAGATSSFMWAQRAGGAYDDNARALAVSGAEVYIAGDFNGGTSVFGPATLTNASFNTYDLFVAKLTDMSTAGNFVWAQRAGGMGGDGASAVALSGTKIYVAGGFGNPAASFGSFTLSNPGFNSSVGYLASLTDPALTATAPSYALAPAQLYPNPARHTVTLHLPAGMVPALLTLTDALGRTVRDFSAPAGPEAVLDLRGLPAGLYLLRGAGPAQRLAVE